MKDKKQKSYGKGGGLYRNLNISVRLLDVFIIGGLATIAFIIMASVMLK